MATPRLSTDELCLLTNNLPYRENFPETSPHDPAKFWRPSCEGRAIYCAGDV